MRDAYRATRFAEQGLLPCAGGTLDQTQSFIDALQQLQSEERRIDAARRSKPFHTED